MTGSTPGVGVGDSVGVGVIVGSGVGIIVGVGNGVGVLTTTSSSTISCGELIDSRLAKLMAVEFVVTKATE